MINIIPMSGSGSRFSDQGYLLPKPLLPISGKPMILRVIENMPEAEKWIFVVRREHVEKYSIQKLIKSVLKEAIIVVEDKPWGQAPSCMEAMPYVNPDEDVFIAACDNAFLYNEEEFNKLKNDDSINAIVWTFTNSILLRQNPQAWGWVKLDDDQLTIKDMSVKVPISNNPINDHAVVASFYFKKAKEFIEAYEIMVREDYRVNNEFYVDSMPIFYNKMNKRSVIFDVNLYVSWGKPADLYQYQLKEYIYKYGALGNDQDEKLWQIFFQSLK